MTLSNFPSGFSQSGERYRRLSTHIQDSKGQRQHALSFRKASGDTRGEQWEMLIMWQLKRLLQSEFEKSVSSAQFQVERSVAIWLLEAGYEFFRPAGLSANPLSLARRPAPQSLSTGADQRKFQSPASGVAHPWSRVAWCRRVGPKPAACLHRGRKCHARTLRKDLSVSPPADSAPDARISPGIQF